VGAVDIRASRRNGRRSSLDAVERDRVLDRVAVDPAHGLTGGDRDRITDELDARYPHFGGNRRAGWAADGDGFRRLVEPGAEPLQVQRDRELEAVQSLALADGIALDRARESFTDFEAERVGRARYGQAQGGAPRGEHRGADKRPDVRAQRHKAVDPRHESAAEAGPRAGLAE